MQPLLVLFMLLDYLFTFKAFTSNSIFDQGRKCKNFHLDFHRNHIKKHENSLIFK
jgi:hypothetical protein